MPSIAKYLHSSVEKYKIKSKGYYISKRNEEI